MSQPGTPVHSHHVSGHAKVLFVGNEAISSSGSDHPVIPFNTVLYDDYGFWDRPNQRFVIPPNMGGLYEIMLQVTFESFSGGTRRSAISSGGVFLSSVQVDPNSAGKSRFTCGFHGVFAPGNEFHGVVLQNSGTILDLIGRLPGGRDIVSMSIIRVRDVFN